ncbi:Ubiquitin carboxyl-terminal hydrolase MINDY-2 [Halocaridina rubra]|uniref:Ubiquitin carboxyl-terminal hydrolase n=1 Tax=Halocaridina rubra TaxID=373956 RepID=A0AAN8WYU0_HALRR
MEQELPDQHKRESSEAEKSSIECEGRVNKGVSSPDNGTKEGTEEVNLCVGKNIIQENRECSTVPTPDPEFSSQGKMETQPEKLVHLAVVPTVEDHLASDHASVGLPDLLMEGSSEAEGPASSSHPRESNNTSPSSDAGVKLCSTSTVEVVSTEEGTDEKSGSAVIAKSSAGGESVLPSMGILPEPEETPVKVITSSVLTSASPSTSAVSEGHHSENRSPENKSLDPSSVVHKIKKIKWQDIEVPIITQNNNGPCPLIAIVNVMLLKGQIALPSDRSEISGGELVLVVGNALFDRPRHSLPSEMRSHLERNTEDAIRILHKLLTGLDVNVKFSGVRDFEFTGELCVFDLLGITLYHGWVVDPSSEVADVIGDLSYNQLTNNIFAWREEALKNNNNDLLVKAILCEEFMSSSGSQLTIHGLFELGSALEREEIAVLFRNNHFSTVYKRGDQLYQLLTDQGFLHENMVWETLNDVDATFSEFVNGSFQPLTHTSEAPSSSTSSGGLTQNMTLQQQINSDQQLAAMLQHEVDLQQQQQQSFERLKDSLGLHNLSDEEIAHKLQEEENRLAAEAEATGVGSPRQTVPPFPPNQSPSNVPSSTHEERKKKDCVIL